MYFALITHNYSIPYIKATYFYFSPFKVKAPKYAIVLFNQLNYTKL